MGTLVAIGAIRASAAPQVLLRLAAFNHCPVRRQALREGQDDELVEAADRQRDAGCGRPPARPPRN